MFGEALAMVSSHLFVSIRMFCHPLGTLFRTCRWIVCKISLLMPRPKALPFPHLAFDIQALWSKSPMHAAVGQQHRRDSPAQQHPNLLEWGLDPDSHVAAARKLAHPCSEAPQTELDLFCCGGCLCLPRPPCF